MPKKLSTFLRAELSQNGWEQIGRGMLDGFVWVSNGIELHIVPSKMSKMYHLTRTKMSESSTSFITEQVLLDIINTQGEKS